ncbi:MAG TPA: Gfo/Idh/MocA family oxidoreductase [Acetobacteraceae bacterium]|nr:Gfo/Idh/MocA family oxidoreductase [Acetobacteraceae bacterium]
MGTIAVALCGAGYWGKNLFRVLSQNAGFRLKYVIDRRPEALDALRIRDSGLAVNTDPAIALNDPEVEALVIATPAATHHDLARRALERGKHVLVEKPMCASADQAADLVARAEAAGLVLMVDHTFLFHPAVVHLKSLIGAGSLGHVSYFDSQRINLGLFQPDVNVLWDLAPHDLSILDHLFGEEPTQVDASGYCHFDPDMADIAYVTLHYPSSMVAHLNLSWMSPVKQRRIAVGGSARMAVWDDLDRNEPLKLFDSGVTWLPQSKRDTILASYRVGDVSSPRLGDAEPLAAVAEHFRRVLVGRERPKADGRHGLRVLRTLERAQSALDENLGRVRRLRAQARQSSLVAAE